MKNTSILLTAMRRFIRKGRVSVCVLVAVNQGGKFNV